MNERIAGEGHAILSNRTLYRKGSTASQPESTRLEHLKRNLGTGVNNTENIVVVQNDGVSSFDGSS